MLDPLLFRQTIPMVNDSIVKILDASVLYLS